MNPPECPCATPCYCSGPPALIQCEVKRRVLHVKFCIACYVLCRVQSRTERDRTGHSLRRLCPNRDVSLAGLDSIQWPWNLLIEAEHIRLCVCVYFITLLHISVKPYMLGVMPWQDPNLFPLDLLPSRARRSAPGFACSTSSLTEEFASATSWKSSDEPAKNLSSSGLSSSERAFVADTPGPMDALSAYSALAIGGFRRGIRIAGTFAAFTGYAGRLGETRNSLLRTRLRLRGAPRRALQPVNPIRCGAR